MSQTEIDLAGSIWNFSVTHENGLDANFEITFLRQWGHVDPVVLGYIDWASAGQPELGREYFNLYLGEDENTFGLYTFMADPLPSYEDQQFFGSYNYSGNQITGSYFSDEIGSMTFDMTRAGTLDPNVLPVVEWPTAAGDIIPDAGYLSFLLTGTSVSYAFGDTSTYFADGAFRHESEDQISTASNYAFLEDGWRRIDYEPPRYDRYVINNDELILINPLGQRTVTTIGEFEEPGWAVGSLWVVEDEDASGKVFAIRRAGVSEAETYYISTVQDRGWVNDGIYTGLLDVPVNFAAGESTRFVSIDFLPDRQMDGPQTYSLIVQTNPNDPIENTVIPAHAFTVPAPYADTGPDDPAAPSNWNITSDVGEDETVFTITRDQADTPETVHVSTVLYPEEVNDGTYTGLHNEPLDFDLGVSSRQVTVSWNPERTISEPSDFTLIVQADPNDPIDTYLARTGFTVPPGDGASSDSDPPPQDDPQPDPDPTPPPQDDPQPDPDPTPPPATGPTLETGQLILTASGGWEDAPGGGVRAVPGHAVEVRHRDGDATLFRIEEGVVTLQGDSLGVVGALWAGPDTLDRPLMRGAFEVDSESLDVRNFRDDTSLDSYRPAAGLVALQFDRLGISQDRISFATDVSFDGTLGVLSTNGAPLVTHAASDGLSFGPFAGAGSFRWRTEEPAALPVPGLPGMTANLTDVSFNYDAVVQAAYLSGRGILDWRADFFNIFGLPEAERSLTLDLAGDVVDGDIWDRGERFIRIRSDGEGGRDWDFVGALSYEASGVGNRDIRAPLIESLELSVDSINQEFGGSAQVAVPFIRNASASAEFGASWEPLSVDSLELGLSGLNQPLGATGFFVQGGSLGAQGLADGLRNSTFLGTVDLTLGPESSNTPVPLRGSIAGEFTPGRIQVTDFNATSRVEDVLPPSLVASIRGGSGTGHPFIDTLTNWFGFEPGRVLDFELLRLQGDADINFLDRHHTLNLDVGLLDNLVSGTAGVSIDARGAHPVIEARLGAEVRLPEEMLAIGGRAVSADALLHYSHDGDMSNDFIAVWTDVALDFRFFSFRSSLGFQVGFDGSFERLGSRDIAAINSWALDDTHELVLLSARWENPSTDATLELIAPDGTIIPEAAFASHDNITLVDDLNSPTARHVALHRPDTGLWRLGLADEDGLGTVTTEADELLRGPSMTFTEVAQTDRDRQFRIELDVDAGDAEGLGVILYASETPDMEGGVRLTEQPLTPQDGRISHLWSAEGLAPGTYHVHARTEADQTAPVFSLADSTIELTGAADLALSMRQRFDDDNDLLFTDFIVDNLGDMPSGAMRLHVEVPEHLVETTAPSTQVPGFETTVVDLDLDPIGPGERDVATFALSQSIANLGGVIAAEVVGTTSDSDMSNNAIAFGIDGQSVVFTVEAKSRAGEILDGVTFTASDSTGVLSEATSVNFGSVEVGVSRGVPLSLEATRELSPGDPEITALDALDVLRLAVGLEPSWGEANPYDYIAADINRDGVVTALDALEVLRHAVGIESESAPEWVFVDPEADLKNIDRQNVEYETGLHFAALNQDNEASVTGILLGSMQEYA